jgi:methionine sulfoxide reductase catalytic subunit
MAAIIVPPKWQMPERSITPESIFCARRNFMKTFGLSGLGLVAGLPFGCGSNENAAKIGAQENPPVADLYPAPRNPNFILDRSITDEVYAASYNNFYEFSVFKGSVYKKAARLKTSPWRLEVAGLVEGRGHLISMNYSEPCLWKKDVTASAVWNPGRWPCRGQGFPCALS